VVADQNMPESSVLHDDDSSSDSSNIELETENIVDKGIEENEGFEILFEPEINSETTNEPNELFPERTLRRSERIKNKTKHCANLAEISEPRTYREAIESENSSDWLEATQREIDSLNLNKTWKLVEKPRNTNIIGSRWVFKIKNDSDSNTIHKARLVAQGYFI